MIKAESDLPLHDQGPGLLADSLDYTAISD